MLEFTREEKSEILRNDTQYPELSRIIKLQNKIRFEESQYRRDV